MHYSVFQKLKAENTQESLFRNDSETNRGNWASFVPLKLNAHPRPVIKLH